MTIEIKFIATDKSDLQKQLMDYLGTFSYEQAIDGLMDPAKANEILEQCEYQGAIDPKDINRDHVETNLGFLAEPIMSPEDVARYEAAHPCPLSKPEILREITALLMAGQDTKAIQATLASEWGTSLSMPVIRGYVGYIRKQQQKGESEERQKPIDAKILSMIRDGIRDPVMIGSVLGNEFGDPWPVEKVQQRMKELQA